MVGDAQAEEPVVEGARSQELQGFEKRAQGCQPSQGETSNMKLLVYIDLRSFSLDRFVSLFLPIWLVINGPNLLQVDNVAGAFLVLMIGMGLSVVTAVVEFFWVSRSALANQNVRYIPWQTPKTANINTNSNWQFPSLIKRSSPDRQSEPFTEWSDVKLWSKRKKGSVHASRFLSQTNNGNLCNMCGLRTKSVPQLRFSCTGVLLACQNVPPTQARSSKFLRIKQCKKIHQN